jgi:hypothetical protein
MLSSQ